MAINSTFKEADTPPTEAVMVVMPTVVELRLTVAIPEPFVITLVLSSVPRSVVNTTVCPLCATPEMEYLTLTGVSVLIGISAFAAGVVNARFCAALLTVTAFCPVTPRAVAVKVSTRPKVSDAVSFTVPCPEVFVVMAWRAERVVLAGDSDCL